MGELIPRVVCSSQVGIGQYRQINADVLVTKPRHVLTYKLNVVAYMWMCCNTGYRGRHWCFHQIKYVNYAACFTVQLSLRVAAERGQYYSEGIPCYLNQDYSSHYQIKTESTKFVVKFINPFYGCVTSSLLPVLLSQVTLKCDCPCDCERKVPWKLHKYKQRRDGLNTAVRCQHPLLI